MPEASNVQIRRATEGDIPEVAKLVADYFGDEAWLTDRLVKTWKNWAIFVAVSDRIVGIAAAEQDYDLTGKPTFHLLHLYIQPEFRGLKLLKSLVESVTNLGSTVWTMAPCTEAHIRMARMFGFHQVGAVMSR